MIRYYAYYNCGGYKDMYIGTDSMNVDATYFVPLLPVWRNRSRSGDSEKIARAESVTHIGLITSTKSYGFPHECGALFSHAGYKAIYMTLQDGTACFCVRDIEEHGRDEENRRTPFNFLFIAEGNDSIRKLDSLALSYLENSNEVENIIKESISYDPVVNAIRFSLCNLEGLFNAAGNLGINHVNGKVAYLKTYNIQNALNELGIEAKDVDVFYDGNNNIIDGKLSSYSIETLPADTKEPEIISVDDVKGTLENEQSLYVSSESDGKVDNVRVEQQNAPVSENAQAVTQVSGADVKNILQTVSDTSKDVVALKGQIYALLKVVSENFSSLETLIAENRDCSESKRGLPNLLSGKLLARPSSKQIMKYLLVLLAGVILGIILF